MRSLPRYILLAGLLPLLLVLAGTLGYSLIEGWSLLDSLYMAVISLSTVGFNEVHELSPAGRIFTVVLILGGVFTIFHAAGYVIAWLVSGEIRGILGSRRMERALSKLSGHIVVCGYGRIGRLVCQDFSSQRQQFVVIERDAGSLEAFSMSHGVALHGDATSDECLRHVGVERARALVAAVGSDADNLYITMSARLLNDKVFIVARAEDINSEQKLLRAGATRVISPYVIGGNRVAQAVLRPNVVDFIELATRTEHLELNIEETEILTGSPLVGKSLRDSRTRQDFGSIIVAIKKPSGKMLFNPAPDLTLEVRDILIVVGHRQDLDRLAALASRVG